MEWPPPLLLLPPLVGIHLLALLIVLLLLMSGHPGSGFNNFTKLLINNSANFLLARLSGIFCLACPLTYQDIPDKSLEIHQFC
jgi:hypothetical protein